MILSIMILSAMILSIRILSIMKHNLRMLSIMKLCITKKYIAMRSMMILSN
jgi:hypothetical protein